MRPLSRMTRSRTVNWLKLTFPVLGLLAISMATADEVIRVQSFGPERYASFIKRWNQDQSPISLTAIDSPKSWDLVFGPAAVMRNRRPFAPQAEEFEKGLLLVIAREGRPPVSDQVLQVEKVTRDGLRLTVTLRYQPPDKEASFTVIHSLGVWVPKEKWESIEFIENGESVGVLEPASGTWAIPARTLEE